MDPPPDSVGVGEDQEVETELALECRNDETSAFKQFVRSIKVGFVQVVAENDVSEVYMSRVIVIAKRMGLKVGWALDLCTDGEEGKPLDFTKAEMRNKAAMKVITEGPFVLIGSPPCTDWSSLTNFNWSKVDPATVKERKRIADCTKFKTPLGYIFHMDTPTRRHLQARMRYGTCAISVVW